MSSIPRLRMFAGPNGSGKSKIKSIVKSAWMGWYINPDEIEADIKEWGYFDFDDFEIETNADEILRFLTCSTFLKKVELQDQIEDLFFEDNRLSFKLVEANSYFASVLADFIRVKLVEARESFSFETVMSFPDKIELLRMAQQRGYRTYLYYVATRDPQINIRRVQNRVALGGHSVPEDKIVERYYRSLNYLSDAIRVSDRAYLFDNSEEEAEALWFAELTEAETIEIKTHLSPQWFKKYVLDKFEVID